VALCRLLLEKPDLLLLDEPTNHLDIEMREALTEALQDYEGALIVVAHDRHLLRATADELWLIADGALTAFEGDLDDYRDWVRSRRAGEAAGECYAEATTPDRKAQKRAEATERQRLAGLRRPLQRKIAEIETEMQSLDAERRDLEAWLASADAYAEGNKEQLLAALERRGDLTWQLARAEEKWLELQGQLEQIG
jgi:ATP-binding cassette subfamily F protein 3